MNRLLFALQRVQFTRAYTMGLLDVKAEDWFRQPAEGVSHMAWQVGHLAVAQFHMALVQVRGEQPQDSDLIPAHYRSLFARGSVVHADASQYPAPPELRAVLDRIHQQIPVELKDLAESELDQPTTRPHPAFKTKFEALIFCGEHEMVHAGQIGLLRRLLGYSPVR